MKVYSLGHGVIPGDAVTTHMLEIDRRLRAWGLETQVFAEHVAPSFRQVALSDVELPPLLTADEAVLIYHYSIYSPNVRLFRAFQGRKMLVYHNITPGAFFRRWDPYQAWLCEMGRRALGTLSSCPLALGDSEYNRSELVEAGFAPQRTGVLPIFVGLDSLDRVEPDGTLLQRLRAGRTVNILSVGRIVPSKAIEEMIRVFYVYHRCINPDSRLLLVGSRYLPAYDEQLAALVHALDIEDAVTMTGSVSPARLKTYYLAADLYLTTSYHEGFCMPLLESMHYGVPILAREAAAIPETLGQAGVLFARLGHGEVAEMAHLLVTDLNLRSQVVATQRARLRDFSPGRVEQQLAAALHQIGILC